MTYLKVRQIQLFYEITDRDKWNNHNHGVWDSNSVSVECDAVFLTHSLEAYTLATLSVTEFEAVLKYRCWNPLNFLREYFKDKPEERTVQFYLSYDAFLV